MLCRFWLRLILVPSWDPLLVMGSIPSYFYFGYFRVLESQLGMTLVPGSEASSFWNFEVVLSTRILSRGVRRCRSQWLWALNSGQNGWTQSSYANPLWVLFSKTTPLSCSVTQIFEAGQAQGSYTNPIRAVKAHTSCFVLKLMKRRGQLFWG